MDKSIIICDLISCKRYSQTKFEEIGIFYIEEIINDDDDYHFEGYYISKYFQITKNKIIVEITEEEIVFPIQYCCLCDIKI